MLVDKISINDLFINKANIVHMNKYDYSLVNYIYSYEKVKIICPIHGIFEQTPNNHLRSGCLKCSIEDKKNKFKSIFFIEKANEIHKHKYDYSLVNYINNKTKVKIICPIHGEFEQTPNNHLRSGGCNKCFGVHKLNTSEFIEKANQIHKNKYNYSLVDYVNSKTKVTITCPIHGDFEQIPNSHLNGDGCLRCSNNYSPNTNEWIDKAKLTHNNKYDYSLVDYGNSKNKVKITCPIHGDFYLGFIVNVINQ